MFKDRKNFFDEHIRQIRSFELEISESIGSLYVVNLIDNVKYRLYTDDTNKDIYQDDYEADYVEVADNKHNVLMLLNVNLSEPAPKIKVCFRSRICYMFLASFDTCLKRGWISKLS